MAKAEMADTDVNSRTVLATAMKWWWLLIVLSLVGGLMGYGIGFFSPRVYEAQTVMGVSVDLTETGELSDIEEDRLMQNIVGNCEASDVLERTLQEGFEQGLIPSGFVLADNLWAERFQFSVTLRARADSPQTAEKLLDIWSKNVYQSLTVASDHALQSGQIRRALDDLTSCYQQSTYISPVSAACSSLTLEQKVQQIEELSDVLAEENAAAKGLAPGTTFLPPSTIDNAQLVTSTMGVYTLAGGLLGLLLGFCLVSLGWLPPRREEKSAA